jgi:predicted nucleotidyltransferase
MQWPNKKAKQKGVLGLEVVEFTVFFCYNIGILINEVMSVVYTIEQLKEKIAPVALKYRLPTVYIFGSYARGDATDTSDVDILVDKTGTALRGLLALGGLYNDLSDALRKPIDLITTGALEQASTRERTPWMLENLNREKIQVYG